MFTRTLKTWWSQKFFLDKFIGVVKFIEFINFV